MKLSTVKRALKFVLKAEIEHSLTGIPRPSLVGDTGIGKTSIVTETFQELIADGVLAKDSKLIIKHLSQVEVGDLVGMPHIDEGSTKWAAPCWWPESSDEGILFLDEFGDVRNEIQRAAQQLLLERKIYTHVLPKKFPIIVAMNPIDSEFGGYDMSRQMMNRVMMWDVQPDPVDWLAYTSSNKFIADGIKQIVASDPSMLHETVSYEKPQGFRNPRSVTAAATLGALMSREERDEFGFSLLTSICGPIMSSLILRSLDRSLSEDELPISSEVLLNDDRGIVSSRLKAWKDASKVELITETATLLKSHIMGIRLTETNALNAFSQKYAKKIAAFCEYLTKDILVDFLTSLNTAGMKNLVYSISSASPLVMKHVRDALSK